MRYIAPHHNRLRGKADVENGQQLQCGHGVIEQSSPLRELIALLNPVATGADTFRGVGSQNDGVDATYGGHLLGQATAAALATVPDDRSLHSLHGYFLLGASPGKPIEYRVERIRDGRSFSHRRVAAHQNDAHVFDMLVSTTTEAEGRELRAELPTDFADLPDPESLPPYPELMAAQDPLPLPAAWALREHGIDVRVVNAPWSPAGPSVRQGIRMWIRTNGTAPRDRKLHAALLVYQSDESIADTVLVPFGATWGSPGVFSVSLDHALWIHRPVNLNEWHFVAQWPVTAAADRGIAMAEVWSQGGQLVASFRQEVLVRVP